MPAAAAGNPDTSHFGEAGIAVVLDMEAVDSLQLNIDAHTVKWSILDTPKIKLKEDMVRAVAFDRVMVYPPDSSRQGLLFSLEQLMAQLPKVNNRHSMPVSFGPHACALCCCACFHCVHVFCIMVSKRH